MIIYQTFAFFKKKISIYHSESVLYYHQSHRQWEDMFGVCKHLHLPVLLPLQAWEEQFILNELQSSKRTVFSLGAVIPRTFGEVTGSVTCIIFLGSDWLPCLFWRNCLGRIHLEISFSCHYVLGICYGPSAVIDMLKTGKVQSDFSPDEAICIAESGGRKSHYE